jgi:hypothetical protein
MIEKAIILRIPDYPNNQIFLEFAKEFGRIELVDVPGEPGEFIFTANSLLAMIGFFELRFYRLFQWNSDLSTAILPQLKIFMDFLEESFALS